MDENNEYISISPLLWGSHGWKFMHYITMCYPKNPTYEQKEHMRNFFSSVQNILPCATCKENFKKKIKIRPLNDEVLSSNDTLVKWLVDIHNDVNKTLGKKVVKYSELKKMYFGETDWRMLIIIFIIVLIIILLILMRLL
jgi:hypothetical protein